MKQETDKHTPENKRKWELQSAILDRAQKELANLGACMDRCNLLMDLDSVPDLDLEGLLKAEPFDFAHDIYGIVRHMDRSSYPGKLMNCFVPRYARAIKRGIYANR